MKKKILAAGIIISMLAIALVGGSLAWFTDEDEATNVFTIGSVEVEVVEDFTSPSAMIPIVNTENPEEDPNFVNKDAAVQNTGKNPAYVQIYIAVPSALNRAGAFHYVEINKEYWGDASYAGTATIDSVEYDVYRYRYSNVLNVGETTPAVITGAYLDAKLDLDKTNDHFIMDGETITGYSVGETINIYVAAQAIQAEGFDDNTALDEFKNHPWAE